MKSLSSNENCDNKKCYEYKVKSILNKRDTTAEVVNHRKNVEWRAAYNCPVEEFVYPSLRLPKINATTTDLNAIGESYMSRHAMPTHISSSQPLETDLSWKCSISESSHKEAVTPRFSLT